MASADSMTRHVTTSGNAVQFEGPEGQQDKLSTISEEFDAEEEEKLVKKLDLYIMPIMAIVYLFQYVDKSSISYAAVFGLRDDLDLTDENFSWAVSMFYVGQLVSQYPAAYILSRFHIIRFIGGTIIAWGIIEMCIGASMNFAGLATCRFLLGFAQAAVSPAFIILTSNWYRQHEHPMRIATWISMNGISQIIGGLLMYALSDVDMEIRSWRVMFLIFGGLTILLGALFMIMMPVDTAKAWFLKERERKVATKRLAIDHATCDEASFDYGQLREALTSPLSWLYFLMAYCVASANPITKYSSIVIDGEGFSDSDTMLVGLPAGLLNFLTSWISALVPYFVPSARIYTAMCLILVPLTGSSMLYGLSAASNGERSWGIVVSTWLATCYTAPLCSCAGLLASNVKGNTKKSNVGAGFFVAYSLGSIIGPQMWKDEDDSRYLTGSIFTIVSWVLLIIVLIIYLLIIKKENKTRDRKAARRRRLESRTRRQGGQNRTQAGVSKSSDLTDVQDKEFRYST